MLALYWWLGENISQRQATLGWGKAEVENLARDLQTSQNSNHWLEKLAIIAKPVGRVSAA